MQNLIPYVWQMVFANIFVKGWIINSDVQSLFYGSQKVLTFSSHYFKVVNGDCSDPSDYPEETPSLKVHPGWSGLQQTPRMHRTSHCHHHHNLTACLSLWTTSP